MTTGESRVKFEQTNEKSGKGSEKDVHLAITHFLKTDQHISKDDEGNCIYQ